MSAPPRRCWVGNAASSVCAVGQRTHPGEVQSEPHLPSNVVLGQLVTERIGLENGIVLSHRSGSTVGGGSPRYRTASLFPFLRTCITAGEPASSSVSSHSLNHLSSWVLAARSKPFKKLKPCFHSGRREWQSPRMGRLALSPEEHASALSAQRRQRKLCPNFFLYNLHTRTLATR